MTPSLNAVNQLSEEITIVAEHFFLHVTCCACGIHDHLRASTGGLMFFGADSPVPPPLPLLSAHWLLPEYPPCRYPHTPLSSFWP